jgi:hypothetical protein
VNGEIVSRRVKCLAEIAGRATAGLLAIGQHHDHAGLRTIVEHLGGLPDGGSERRLAAGSKCIHLPHDELAGIRCRLEIELYVALLIGARPIGDEPDAAKPGDARQDLGERRAHRVDPRRNGGDALVHVASHRPGGVEHEHGILDARLAV